MIRTTMVSVIGFIIMQQYGLSIVIIEKLSVKNRIYENKICF